MVSGITGISFVEIKNKIPETPWQQKFGNENAPKIRSGGDEFSARRLIYPTTAALSVVSLGAMFQAHKIMLPGKLSMWSYTINSFWLLE